MRPLRGALPLVALLLLAPILTGQADVAAANEPFVRMLVLSPSIQCAIPGLESCTLLMDAWRFESAVAEGLTAVVVELRDPSAIPSVVAVAPVVAELRFGSPATGDRDLAVFDGGRAAFRAAWDDPLAGETWSFHVTPKRVAPLEGQLGAHNLVFAEGVQVGVTFAFWGYALPDDHTLFPDDHHHDHDQRDLASQPQTLLDNLDLSDSKLPCASTSSIPRDPARVPVSPARTC